MTATKHRLSKSRYMDGRQCLLKLWYGAYRPELAPPPDETQRYVFARGTRVGELARDCFDGVLIHADHTEIDVALSMTASLLAADPPAALFEPAFVHRDVLMRADVLARAGARSWDLIEVKSACSAKEVYVNDVAVQLWILRGAGVRAESAQVMVLDRSYLYDGRRLDVDALFKLVDVTDRAEAQRAEIEQRVEQQHAVLAAAEPPPIEPGAHCHEPYPCPFIEHCWRDVATCDHPIDELPRLHKSKRALLEAQGVAEVADIPPDFPLTDKQEIVRQAVVSGRDWMSDDLDAALSSVEYPLYHLDFESFGPAVPRFAWTRAYDAIPFQFSIHVEQRSGALKHLEYLHTDEGDPRPAVAQALVDRLSERGTICTYSSYERRVLKELASAVPALAGELKALRDRCWDLAAAIRGSYYHPEFHGKYSIKRVLPALVSGLDYGALEIGDGMAASIAYEHAIDRADAAERERIFAALRRYCGLDTLGMVRLRGALIERVRTSET